MLFLLLPLIPLIPLIPPILLIPLLPVARAANMNLGGVPYSISNIPGSSPTWEGTPGTYSTHFEDNVQGEVEHFDVYGEVQTLYSQVYWTRNRPVSLPPALVARFSGRVMAITGYEVDQVTHPAPAPDSSSSPGALGGFSCYPDCGQEDQSVPIYQAYNHHYFSWLTGSDSELYDLEEPAFLPNPTYTAFRNREGTDHGFPTNIVFKENPGGEFRKSYHGYPRGYGQLLHSPSHWVVEPMQIDTHNRGWNITDQVGLKPWFLPQTLSNNMTDLASGLSPLIECPCSDRIRRSSETSSSLLTSGSCTAPLSSLADCRAQIQAAGGSVTGGAAVQDVSWPPGCTMWPKDGNSFSAIFNTAASSHPCGNSSSVALHGTAKLGTQASMTISHDTVTALISLVGPADVWFGVGLDASAMADKPYAIIVDGSGAVSERRLENHGPGSELEKSVTVISNKVTDNVRTVVMHRSVPGLTKAHYSLPVLPGDLSLISALGSSPSLSYHASRQGGRLSLLPSKTMACVCQPTTTDYLSYMDEETQQFQVYDCLKEPRSNMAQHGDGTGRELPNPACHMATYHGGLQCCKHSWLLTDRNQDSLVPKDKVDTYYLKWRYYFQEYKPATEQSPASHKHLHHWVFLIDAEVNDYEEDNASYGSSSLGSLTAHLTAGEMGLEDLHKPTDDGAPPVPKNFTTITPLVVTPHCHAPSCIRQELWNADTNEIICNMTAQYGSEEHGSTNQVFNEADYLTIHPCLYGFQPGLQFPFNLTAETNITAVKYFNNTFRHLGQMAQWTGLMVYDTDPY